MRRLMQTVANNRQTFSLLASHLSLSVRDLRTWPKRDLEQALADLTIEIAHKAGAQYDRDRESPPRIDDLLHRCIWRVYLQTRNARIASAMDAQAARHTP
jgi:hypothetical protein